MKVSTLFFGLVAATLLVIALPSAAFAGDLPPAVSAPEPASLIVWGGLACAGGVGYWLRNRRQS